VIDIDEGALARIYGNRPDHLKTQRERYRRALRAFAASYGPGEVFVYHAPGRVNLIGEHTDYNHGYVMPVALDRDVLLLVRPRQDQTVRLTNVESDFGSRQFELIPQIPPAPLGDWTNYAQGPAQLLAQEFGPGLKGVDALVDGAPPFGVPRGAGLSSSSALTVAVAAALADQNHLPIQGQALADACGRAEWYVGTRGGIMDQFISVLGRQEHALFLDCRPKPDGSGYPYRHVPLPSDYSIIVADSGVRHANTGPLFNRRVAEGRIGVRILRKHFAGITHLRDVNHLPWSEIEPLLPEVITSDALRKMHIDPDTILDSGVSPETDTFFVRKRCRHVITENNRVLAACEALEQNDIEHLGRLLNEAHASARDDYEISIPEIETLVALAKQQPGVKGARLTGAGWGGCIVAIVRQENAPAFSRDLTEDYRRETGLETRVFACQSARGAGLVLQAAV